METRRARSLARSPPSAPMPRFLLLALLLSAATAASAQTLSGRLEADDDTLNSGEYVDEYTVVARAGQTVSAVVTSEMFDTYVILVSASGAQAEDDDCTDGETTRSCGALVADVDGEVRVLVTSFAVGETGDYEVTLSLDDGVSVEDGGGTGTSDEGGDTLRP